MQDPLEDQPPERLEVIAEYASDLAAWKRAKRKQELEQRRAEEAVDENELEGLEERDVSTDSEDYETVPASGAYITTKETKPGYHYYYWQWRDRGSQENEYTAPVNPKR